MAVHCRSKKKVRVAGEERREEGRKQHPVIILEIREQEDCRAGSGVMESPTEGTGPRLSTP